MIFRYGSIDPFTLILQDYSGDVTLPDMDKLTNTHYPLPEKNETKKNTTTKNKAKQNTKRVQESWDTLHTSGQLGSSEVMVEAQVFMASQSPLRGVSTSMGVLLNTKCFTFFPARLNSLDI